MIKISLFVILSVVFQQNIFSQNSESNLRQTLIQTGKDTTIIIDGFLLPNSISIHPSQFSHLFTLEPSTQFLKIRSNATIETETVTLQYRVLPSVFEQKFCLIDSNQIKTNDKVIDIGVDLTPDHLDNEAFISSNKLKYDGSFARGLSVGNNQDLVLNSNFNMSLSGELRGGLQIKGVISDENIPIQAEGNTQQLQEFDKVYIEVSKDQSFLKAGDYIIKEDKSYFSRYLKKLQGAAVGHSITMDSTIIYGEAGYAVSKGKFARQTLMIQEGNQGPYKLTGADGERFLIVLSGTEKVFYDGKLLTRGQQYDYVIDYNTAEIEFTINQIIRANARIIVEYEYTDQNYLRTLYSAKAGMSSANWDVHLDIFSQQDSRNVAGFADLDSTQIAILNQSGDNLSEAVVNSIFDPGDPDADVSWYQIVFDPDNNLNYLSHIDEYQEGAITANFSEVPLMTGSYSINETKAANNRVYDYVGPGNGNYEPQTQLIPPRQQQLITLSTQYGRDKPISIGGELALSNNDQNRFSSIDQQDNVGVASSFFINQKKELSQWKINSTFFSEYKQKYFQAINPYRDTEFQRIWSLVSQEESFNELLTTTKMNIGYKEKLNFLLEHHHLSQFTNYQGNKVVGGMKFKHKDWEIESVTSLLRAKEGERNVSFLIPDISLVNNTKRDNWGFGVSYYAEDNKSSALNGLDKSSFRFHISEAYGEHNITDKLNVRIGFIHREDFGLSNENLDIAFRSNEYTSSINWNPSERVLFKLQGSYRDVTIVDQEITTEEPRRGLFARIENKLNLANGGIRSETLIESGSGQEPKQEFKFLEVQQGEGSYLWNDYNVDSIQQINEFEVAPFSDLANYERFVVFNNEFIRTTKNELTQILSLSPKSFLKKQDGFNSVIKRLSLRSRTRLSEKFEDQGDNGSAFTKWSLKDDDIVSFNYSYDHSMFFNQGSTDYDLQFSVRDIRSKLVFISGFEERSNFNYYGRSRINIRDNFDFIVEGETGNRISIAQNYEAKNFNVSYWNIRPSLTWRMGTKFRLKTSYAYIDQENIQGFESAVTNNLGAEITWRRALKSNLQTRLEYVINSFDGNSGSPLELDMLGGLKSGKNYVWSLNYTQRIGKQIDATFNYNGRKSEESNSIHTLSAQMKLLF